MHDRYGAKIYGRYGFVDAFNPKTNWTDTDVIGINAGIILLSAENMRTASIWRWFMANREIQIAPMRAGLRKYSARSKERKNLLDRITRFSRLSCKSC